MSRSTLLLTGVFGHYILLTLRTTGGISEQGGRPSAGKPRFNPVPTSSAKVFVTFDLSIAVMENLKWSISLCSQLFPAEDILRFYFSLGREHVCVKACRRLHPHTHPHSTVCPNVCFFFFLIYEKLDCNCKVSSTCVWIFELSKWN